jgi:hypothetical protein
MNTFIGKLRELISHNRPKFIAFVVAVAALSLPFVINQVLKQQDLRQRADTAPSITFSFSPGSQNMTVNQTLNVDLVMNAGTNDIGSLHFSLKYDPTMLQVTELSQSTALQSIQKTNSQGVFDAVMINPTVTPVTGNGLKVFTFQLKALKSGTANVALDPATLQATSQLSTTYLLVDNKDNIKGSYIITASTADNGCNVTTNKPANCTCTVAADCASGVCSPSTTNQDGKVCVGGTPSTTVTVAPSTTVTVSPSTTTTTSPSVTITSSVTPTQIPTVTLTPGETGLKLSLSLPGISKVNGENAHPLRTRRIVKVTVYDNGSPDDAHIKVAEKTGTVDFNPTTARYEGTVGIGTTLDTGTYTVKVRMDNTLKKQLPGAVSITKGKADNNTPPAELVTGDLNQNNALDIQDFTNVMACYNHLAACTGDVLILGDLDDDGVTNGDNDDISIMQYNTINRKGD